MGAEDEEVRRLDEALALLARQEAALRLCLGQALEVLSKGGVFELGFSSLAAYAIERCDRSGRWAEGARCLARRVEVLPQLREAVAAGRISWSMAELVARVAEPEDEGEWLESAESRTVRQMRVLAATALAVRREADRAGASKPALSDVVAQTAPASAAMASADERGTVDELRGICSESSDAEGSDAEGEMCTLTCTVPNEDAWLFEATRLLLGQMGVKDANEQCETLLAEGQGTLLGGVPDLGLDPDGWKGLDPTQQRWVRELARWRLEAEASCEEHIAGSLFRKRAEPLVVESGDRWQAKEKAKSDPGGVARRHRWQSQVAAGAAHGMAPLEHSKCDVLDGLVRDLSRALAQHELDVSRMVLRFHRANGWRALGYATESQYARERLGVSPSALRGRRSLALRLEGLPRVAAALGTGKIGVEAALQVVRVATARTELAWVKRARHRTVKHLREEVAAALVAVRFSGEVDCEPPLEGEMAVFQTLEQAVVSGRVCHGEAAPAVPDISQTQQSARAVSEDRLVEPTSAPRRAWLVMLASLTRWLEQGFQLSAVSGSDGGVHTPTGSGPRSKGVVMAGRVTLRLRMLRSTYAWWRGLEVQARRWLPTGMSWLRYLCLAIWEAWRHTLGPKVAYAHVYARDCNRCVSPVCTRRDVTPHHLRFRSAGGSDDPRNIGSFCVWCHLYGVHGGRIRATGTASLIHWEFGPVGSPCLVVHGRERRVA